MKRTGLLLLILLGTLNLWAQNFKYSYSDKVPYNYYKNTVSSGRTKDFIFQVRYNYDYKGAFVNVFDATSLKFVKTQEFIPNANNNLSPMGSIRTLFVKALYMKDGFILFFENINMKTKKRTLLAQKFNNNADLVGGIVELDQKDTDFQFYCSYEVLQFNDNTRFMVLNISPIAETKERFEENTLGLDLYYSPLSFDNTFECKIFDFDLKKIKTLNPTLPYKKYLMAEVYEVYLGYNDNLYMLNKFSILKEEAPKGQPDYFMSLLTINTNTSEVAENKINFPSKCIEDITLLVDRNSKNITCAGLYSNIKPNKNRGDYINGFFNITFDATNQQIVSQGILAMENSIIAGLTGKSLDKVKDNFGISKQCKIRSLVKRFDGSYTLLSELYDMSNEKHVKKEILITCFSSKGNISTVNYIPKNQIELQSTISFTTCYNDKKLFVIYNDNSDNLNNNTKNITKMSDVEKAMLVSVEINDDGTYTKTKIQDNATKNLRPLPSLGTMVGNGEFVIPVHEPQSYSATFGNTNLKGFIKIDLN